jgi:hypothetical protein
MPMHIDSEAELLAHRARRSTRFCLPTHLVWQGERRRKQMGNTPYRASESYTFPSAVSTL